MLDNERSFEETPPEVPPDVAFPEDIDDAPAATGGDDADPVEVVASAGSDRADDTPTLEQPVEVAVIPPVDGLDIEGALAAVASLSDILAEQEAAEQARLARAEAEAIAAAERQTRLEHPELFFPMPPPATLHRGHIASVVPALLLILTGGWLTITLTIASPINPFLVAVVAIAGIAVTLFVHWLSSGRWARGALFFALLLLLMGVAIVYLVQPSAPGLVQGWPLLLLAVGGAFLLAGLIGQPVERRVLLPALAFAVAGLSALTVTTGALSSTLAVAAASWWLLVALVVLVIWLLPVVFRQRR
jgi:hypothetical protein